MGVSPQNKRERKKLRYKGYDYSQSGWYYVTICVNNRINYFGTIKDHNINVNEFGQIVKECWLDLPNHYGNTSLDEFIIMPNHVHGIIVIHNSVGNGLKPFPTKNHSLSEIIRGFKTFSSRKINERQNRFKFKWQKSFYDHIIHNEQDYLRIKRYIQDNPGNWESDEENPDRLKNNE